MSLRCVRRVYDVRGRGVRACVRVRADGLACCGRSRSAPVVSGAFARSLRFAMPRRPREQPSGPCSDDHLRGMLNEMSERRARAILTIEARHAHTPHTSHTLARVLTPALRRSGASGAGLCHEGGCTRSPDRAAVHQHAQVPRLYGATHTHASTRAHASTSAHTHARCDFANGHAHPTLFRRAATSLFLVAWNILWTGRSCMPIARHVLSTGCKGLMVGMYFMFLWYAVAGQPETHSLTRGVRACVRARPGDRVGCSTSRSRCS